MGEKYLWDKSGEPDGEIQHLEQLLGRLSLESRPDRELELGTQLQVELAGLQAAQPEAHSSRPFLLRPLGLSLVSMAAAACVLLVFGNWFADRLDGRYRVTGADDTWLVGVGDSVESSSKRLTMQIADLGEVDLEPASRVRVEDIGGEAHKLYLEEGVIQARIYAEPRLFQVDTPAGLTVDLGCVYRLAVDEAGVSHLRVDSGQVAFEFDGREVYVPAGAACSSLPGRGPGAPVFDWIDPAFKAAVERVEFAQDPDPEDLAVVLAADDREYALTLWHLLDAPSEELRKGAFELLSKFFPKPPGATDAGLLGADPQMRAAWREEMEPHWRVRR